MLFFFFNDTATTEIYTLSLHDALPIYRDHDHGLDAALAAFFRVEKKFGIHVGAADDLAGLQCGHAERFFENEDRKSTRLNSSHLVIPYAVFCLKKKKTTVISTSDTESP